MLFYQGLIGLGLVSILHFGAGILKWWNYHQIQELIKDGGLIGLDDEIRELGNADPEFVPSPSKVILTQFIHAILILYYPIYGFAVSKTEFLNYKLSIDEILTSISGFFLAYFICHKFIKINI